MQFMLQNIIVDFLHGQQMSSYPMVSLIIIVFNIVHVLRVILYVISLIHVENIISNQDFIILFPQIFI